MDRPFPPRMRQFDALIDLIADAADAAAAESMKRYRRRPRRRPGMRPVVGEDTPLWNILAETCANQLTRYGDKARLARMLGVPRQRVHLLFVARSACPDAERTLQLLVWLRTGRGGARQPH